MIRSGSFTFKSGTTLVRESDPRAFDRWVRNCALIACGSFGAGLLVSLFLISWAYPSALNVARLSGERSKLLYQAMLVGCFATLMAWWLRRTLRTGRATLNITRAGAVLHFDRQAAPVRFWLMIAIYAALAASFAAAFALIMYRAVA